MAVSDPIVAHHLLADIHENELDDNGQSVAQWLLKNLMAFQSFTHSIDKLWTQKNDGGGLRLAADKHAPTMVRSWYRRQRGHTLYLSG